MQEANLKMITTCKEQEKKYRFDSLSHQDFIDLGEILKNLSASLERPLALEVAIGDLVVYKYIPEGRGIYEENWLASKRKTVMAFGLSSLHTMLKMQGKGLSQAKDYSALDPGKYALSGGGFPIKLSSGLLVGSICASGLTGEEDHALLVEALEQFQAAKKGEA